MLQNMIIETEIWLCASVCCKTRRLNPSTESLDIKGQNREIRVTPGELATLVMIHLVSFCTFVTNNKTHTRTTATCLSSVKWERWILSIVPKKQNKLEFTNMIGQLKNHSCHQRILLQLHSAYWKSTVHNWKWTF